MALKGSATIEITNADGSKEIIKHDNMITSAVNDLCLSQRGEMAAILKMVNQNDSYAQAMFGGLLLFGDELNNNADDYEIPSTNIVGYASQSAYAGLDLARGSFNETEGGVQADGSYKFVWDFNTSQANGTIKSVALCPNIMGKIGASDTIVDGERDRFDFVKEPTAPFNSYGWMLSDSGTTEGLPNWCFHIVAIIGDIAYAVNYYNLFRSSDSKYETMSILDNTGKLNLYKFRLGTESISLSDKVATAKYIEKVDIQLPTELISFIEGRWDIYTVSCYYNQRDKKLNLFPIRFNSDVQINENIPYVEIELENSMAVSLKYFKNTTAGYIDDYGDSTVATYDAKYNYCVFNDYILAIGKNGSLRNLYVVNKANNSDVKKVTIGDSDVSLVGSSDCFAPFHVSDNTVVIGIAGSTATSYTDFYIIDFKTGKAKKLNITSSSPISSKANVSFGNKVVKIRTGSYLTYYVTINPFILTTKNNLDSPVVKTASQTMKITYTLSEVEESEV